MDKYIRKITFDFNTQNQVIAAISYIDYFKGKWEVSQTEENGFFKELSEVAFFENIGSAIRLAGGSLSNEDIRTLLYNIDIVNLDSEEDLAVVGYFNALEYTLEHSLKIQLSQTYIKEMHSTILRHSRQHGDERGVYKKILYSEDGDDGIDVSTKPHLIERELIELFKWTNAQMSEKTLHPLIVTGVFIYEFLSIHPFETGNMRVALLAVTLLLLRNNYKFIHQMSFAKIIELQKKDYFDSLAHGQKKKYIGSETIEKWMIFFLNGLKMHTENLEKKYDILKLKGGYLNERQKKIKKFISESQPVKLSDISGAFPDISVNTLKKDLGILKAQEIVFSVGKNKGMVYYIK